MKNGIGSVIKDNLKITDVNNKIKSLAQNVTQQLKSLSKPDVPNYVCTSTASALFGALSLVEDGLTSYLLFGLSLASGALAINQYGIKNTYQTATSGFLTLFKSPKEQRLEIKIEDPVLRKRTI